MNLRLDGKNALVCGSSRGIGRAVARQFAEMGANVTLLARNEEALRKTTSNLHDENTRTHSYIACDFNEPEKVIEKVNKYIERGRTFHILVDNSGGPPPGPAHQAAESEFDSAFRQHLIMSQMLVKALIPGMKKAGYGRIINIISIGVKQPIENLGVSNTIRGAMASWSKTISRELAPFGITVNNILPGHTKTGRLDSLIKDRAENEGKTVEQIEAEMKSQIPAGRFAKPEELGYAAGFLASVQASFITGISLPVDGGFLKCI